MSTRAMLLTAGLGERMQPLTARIPKPALPVLGRPLVVQLLSWLQHSEPEWVVLNLHHRGDEIEGMLGSGSEYGLPAIRYSREETLLGTGGGLRQAGPLLLDETHPNPQDVLILSNGDFLSDIDLAAAVEAHKRSGDLATLVLAPERAGYAAVEVDGDGRVLALNGHPKIDPELAERRHLFTGCHILSPELLDLIPETMPSDIVKNVYRRLAARKKLGSYVHDGFWWEFGTPEQYLVGSMKMIGGGWEARRKITEHDPLHQLDEALAACGTGAHYHAEARFRGRIALGFASEVGKASIIEDTMIMPEAWIGPGSKLNRCIVGRGVELPAGFEGHSMLICSATGAKGDGVEGSASTLSTRREGNLLIRPLGRLPELA